MYPARQVFRYISIALISLVAGYFIGTNIGFDKGLADGHQSAWDEYAQQCAESQLENLSKLANDSPQYRAIIAGCVDETFEWVTMDGTVQRWSDKLRNRKNHLDANKINDDA